MPVTIQEPPPTPDDTAKTDLQPRNAQRSASPNRFMQIGVLGIAVLITVAAAVVYTQPAPSIVATVPQPTVIVLTALPTSTALPPTAVPPTQVAATDVPVAQPQPQSPASDVLAALQLESPDTAPPVNSMFHRDTAFTIAPAGPRASTITYIVQAGDTLESIAKQFNLNNDTLLWNNDIQYINRLSIGTKLTIPPVDGLWYKPTADQTLQAIAEQFKVSPYAIINSEYNKLQNAQPAFLVPANALNIFIPGGVTKTLAVYWNPVIKTTGSVSNCGNDCGSVARGGTIEFGGGPGSCGFQPNGGGDGSLGKPLSGYTVVRGFTNVHSGIDLARPPGSPVFAAGLGTVIFAGWSDWGYGNSIVIAHTPNLMTLYGHLSQINVGCGQLVGRGQLIGAVGSTGNSTGPHLHFEIRINQVPVDPRSMMGF